MKAKLVKESLNEFMSEGPRRGAKRDAVIDYVRSAGPKGVTTTDIRRFAYEWSNGEGTYDPILNRGYWGNNLAAPTEFRPEAGYMLRYLTKNEAGRWVVREDDSAEG